MLNINAQFCLFTVSATDLACIDELVTFWKPENDGLDVELLYCFCLRSVQNQSTNLFYDVFAEIARSNMFTKHD